MRDGANHHSSSTGWLRCNRSRCRPGHVGPLLAHARKKTGAEVIEWVEADIRSFNLNRAFELIIGSGMSFEHLLTRTDQEAALASIHNHLAADGYFVISIRIPTPDLMKNSDGEQSWYSYMAEGRGEVQLSGEDLYDALNQVRHETVYRRWVD